MESSISQTEHAWKLSCSSPTIEIDATTATFWWAVSTTQDAIPKNARNATVN
jgi:hypothetical protein